MFFSKFHASLTVHQLWLSVPLDAASSEDLDWSSAAGGSSGPPDWPSTNSISAASTGGATTTATDGHRGVNPGGDSVVAPQDNLQSVLERLGLMAFHQLFQVCTGRIWHPQVM